MALSEDQKIDLFESITYRRDRENVIDFLTRYEWDIYTAIEAYYARPEEISNVQSKTFTLFRTNSRETHSLVNASLHSFNSLRPSLTSSNYNQSTTTSNTETFDDQMNPLLKSNITTISPIFPHINQFGHDKKQLLQYIDSNIIGKNLLFDTPWGSREIIYADYTASGRALIFIEQYILSNVLPYYANTHSENNACALQTTKFREGSRAMIKRYVNATDDDVLIFTGSGSTAAINKLVDVLHLKDEQVRSTTVVFISTFEHHSNILPWKETGVEVIRIPNNKLGLLDEDFLQNQLKYYRDEVKKHIICTFNAASNVTGIRTDVDHISKLVHQYDGLIFWDYAAAAPYIKVDMNPSKFDYKDAVFISTHKFIGGPSTPGILIAKKKLFTNQVPSACGGGTVNFVTREHVEYATDIETREEGGTPNILGAIRAGLVFHLKESVGCDTIEAREDALVSKFFTRFRNHQTLFILGSSTVSRLGIFSFLIYVPFFQKYLHHNFICVLLNDLFGIQVRSGCSCAGPYVLDLLNINDQAANIYTRFITVDENARSDGIPKIELMKPGFTRFNLSYFASDEEVDYILNAVEFIANDGWKFLPLYTYDPQTAVWHSRTMSSQNQSSQYHSLQMITYANGTMEENIRQQQNELFNSNAPHLIINPSSDDPIEEAKSIANNIPKYVYENFDSQTDPPLNIPDEYTNFVWFVIPRDIIRKMIIDFGRNKENTLQSAPFRPRVDD
ncbi:unnamed protein product [Rotaria sordida]|uniref:Aminotransferase class V domain-containing protein n=1 Tax=Rotaria sordida TaxID=392033 RepID=A0A814QF43_9BILA|nr:unnamed protein product [Rotaria sordida]CAF1118639.1 unnamed protein product [Rotaria sordida]